jgi:hypothetical protein
MQELKQEGLVDLVYPEFFDEKDSLIARRWSAYLRKLRQHESEVKVAVWPDYCYDARLRDRFNVEWVFPLHRRDELGFALRVADYVAFPNRDDLRDYTLSWFLEQKRLHGFRAWLLGLKPRYLNVLHLFDACDITPMSVPGFSFSRSEHFHDLEVCARFLEKLRKSGTTLEVWLRAGNAHPQG